jgi:hypothetical protein
MNIAPNAHNIQKRIDYALANLKQNAPDLAARMSWHWTEIVMSKRLRRVMGKCIFWRAQDRLRLEFSEPLFNAVPEMEKTDTVIHELAHAVCFRLGLSRKHDAQFRRVCRAMGGTGDRVYNVAAGVIKRNLVKRWVLVRKDDPKLTMHIRTKKDAGVFTNVYRDALLLGVIQIDRNEKKIKWVQSMSEGVRTICPYKDYELVA